ncbi:hypothetical protein [Streptococcus infantarius]|uniref:hypothetical protein n=1 Tax=Streptococcus infantarius TaxID=102684 RepID=UPI0022E513B0|nr:hypothetical protein [Streptococcus infantarius]
MRFDKRVTLILKSKEKPYYDAELGKMVGGDTTKKVVPANISPISIATQSLLGDKLKEATTIVRVRNCKDKVDSLSIDGQSFSIVSNSNSNVFYVSEVNHGSS